MKRFPAYLELKLEVNEYVGVFKARNSRGSWRKIWQVGNAGVALDIANFLRRLKHKVEIEEYSVEEP